MNTFRCIIGLQVPPIFGHNCSPVIVLLSPGTTVYGQPFAKRFVLCYRTVVPSDVRSVTLVYCGQTVGWIKTKLRMEVGLEPGHIVLDGDPAPPKKGSTRNFRPMSLVAKRLDGPR